MASQPNVIWFEDLERGNVALVGGKNASLGEMVRYLRARGGSDSPRLCHHVPCLLAVRGDEPACRRHDLGTTEA